MRCVLCLPLALLPFSAPALTFAPDCYVNEASGLLVTPSDPGATLAVWPQPHPGGVVSWSWTDQRGRAQGAVQICDGGQALRYSIPSEGFDPLSARLHEMLESSQTFTLRDLRAEVRQRGGRAWLTSDLGRCGCDLHGF